MTECQSSKRREFSTKDEVINFLWQLLDNIDTAGDVAKSNDVAFRKMVEKYQKQRWETGIEIDNDDKLVLPEGLKVCTNCIETKTITGITRNCGKDEEEK